MFTKEQMKKLQNLGSAGLTTKLAQVDGYTIEEDASPEKKLMSIFGQKYFTKKASMKKIGLGINALEKLATGKAFKTLAEKYSQRGKDLGSSLTNVLAKAKPGAGEKSIKLEQKVLDKLMKGKEPFDERYKAVMEFQKSLRENTVLPFSGK